eukprot:1158578-Pelagomonas_calceolata.AAC.4
MSPKKSGAHASQSNSYQHGCTPTAYRAWQNLIAHAPAQAYLMQKEGTGHVPHLLVLVPAFSVCVEPSARAKGDQVSCLLMPELDVVAQHVDIKQLPHVLAPGRVQLAPSCPTSSSSSSSSKQMWIAGICSQNSMQHHKHPRMSSMKFYTHARGFPGRCVSIGDPWSVCTHLCLGGKQSWRDRSCPARLTPAKGTTHLQPLHVGDFAHLCLAALLRAQQAGLHLKGAGLTFDS